MILDEHDMPFSHGRARVVRDALNRETDKRYELVPVHWGGQQAGYGVEQVDPDAPPEPPPRPPDDEEPSESLRQAAREYRAPASAGEPPRDHPADADAEVPTYTLRPALRSVWPTVLKFVLLLAVLAWTPEIVAWLGQLPDPVGASIAEWRMTIPGIGELPIVQAALSMILGIWMVLTAIRIVFAIYYYRFTLDPDRVTVQTGIIARHRRTLRYANARIPTLEQGVIDRLIGIGEVRVSSAGGGETGEIRLHGIRRPLEVKEEIQRRVDAVWDR